MHAYLLSRTTSSTGKGTSCVHSQGLHSQTGAFARVAFANWCIRKLVHSQGCIRKLVHSQTGAFARVHSQGCTYISTPRVDDIDVLLNKSFNVVVKISLLRALHCMHANKTALRPHTSNNLSKSVTAVTISRGLRPMGMCLTFRSINAAAKSVPPIVLARVHRASTFT